MNQRPSLDEYWMGVAIQISRRATCEKRKVGAVIVDENNRLIATGYNGAPKGVAHCRDYPCPKLIGGLESGRGHDICIALHAEENAILQVAISRDLIQSTLYCINSPCFFCAKRILQVGIRRVVYLEKYADEFAIQFLEEHGVLLDCISLGDPSTDLYTYNVPPDLLSSEG